MFPGAQGTVVVLVGSKTKIPKYQFSTCEEAVAGDHPEADVQGHWTDDTFWREVEELIPCGFVLDLTKQEDISKRALKKIKANTIGLGLPLLLRSKLTEGWDAADIVQLVGKSMAKSYAVCCSPGHDKDVATGSAWFLFHPELRADMSVSEFSAAYVEDKKALQAGTMSEVTFLSKLDARGAPHMSARRAAKELLNLACSCPSLSPRKTETGSARPGDFDEADIAEAIKRSLEPDPEQVGKAVRQSLESSETHPKEPKPKKDRTSGESATPAKASPEASPPSTQDRATAFVFETQRAQYCLQHAINNLLGRKATYSDPHDRETLLNSAGQVNLFYLCDQNQEQFFMEDGSDEIPEDSISWCSQSGHFHMEVGRLALELLGYRVQLFTSPREWIDFTEQHRRSERPRIIGFVLQDFEKDHWIAFRLENQKELTGGLLIDSLTKSSRAKTKQLADFQEQYVRRRMNLGLSLSGIIVYARSHD